MRFRHHECDNIRMYESSMKRKYMGLTVVSYCKMTDSRVREALYDVRRKRRINDTSKVYPWNLISINSRSSGSINGKIPSGQ